MGLAEDYKKYKWFFTASGKLVVCGKNAEQNDILLKEIKKENKAHLVMHTLSPGSPFCVILSSPNNLSEKDKLACAVFTACFSQAFKQGKKKIQVDSFLSSSLCKTSSIKIGTWAVKKRTSSYQIKPKLFLTKQKNIIKAVPEHALKPNQKTFFEINQGKEIKSNLLKIIKEKLKDASDEEILSALPSGGLQIK